MQRLFCWGLVLWLFALVSAAVEIGAQQTPDSGLHLGVPVGPITLFKQQCAFLGIVLALVELRGHNRVFLLCIALLVGIALTLGAQGLSAVEGFYAVTPSDFRPAAQLTFWLRVAGHGILATCLLWLMKREFKSGGPRESR